VPSYGESSLADLSASILASLTGDAAGNVLGLPDAGRACLLIVDGLGWELLRAHQAAAPFLAELAFNSRPLTAGFPATTVTSLGTIGTGLPSGAHGLLGYQVAVPGEGRLLKAALRGADYRRANSLGALADATAAALNDSERALVTAYHGDVDALGHEFGASSPAWTFQLAHVDKLAEQIAGSLPFGTVLYVTADHGMVNVGLDDRIDVDATPALREGVDLLGGEPRARHVYARPGAAADVLATWQEILGERAWVASREEAIKDGWFGPVDDAMTPRIGDVVAAAAGTTAIIASRAEPLESALIGMHGSLTSAEQLVPVLAFAPR